MWAPGCFYLQDYTGMHGQQNVKFFMEIMTLYPGRCGNVNLRSTFAALYVVTLHRVPGGKALPISDLGTRWK